MNRPSRLVTRMLVGLLASSALIAPIGCSNEPPPPKALDPGEQAKAEAEAKAVMSKEYGGGYSAYEKKAQAKKK